MEEKRKPTRWLLWLMAAVVVVAIPTLSPLLMFETISQKSAAFLKRANEAGPAIEAVYLEYHKTRKWPVTLDQLKLPRVEKIPDDWQYQLIDDPGVGLYPVLRLRGPLHMQLEYAFRKSGDIQSPGGWTSKMGGDPVYHQFSELVPPKPQVDPAQLKAADLMGQTDSDFIKQVEVRRGPLPEDEEGAEELELKGLITPTSEVPSFDE